MAHFKRIPQYGHEGKIAYGKNIINGIVFLAVSELDDVIFAYKNKEKNNYKDIIKVSKIKKLVDVSVNINVLYSQSITDASFRVQEAIRHSIETMTQYTVNSVNVKVSGVYFEEIKQNEESSISINTKIKPIEQVEITPEEENQENSQEENITLTKE